MPDTFLPPKGNYRALIAFQKAQCIYDITFYFAHTHLQHGDRTTRAKNSQEDRRFNRRTGFNQLIIRYQPVEPWLAAAYPDGHTANN